MRLTIKLFARRDERPKALPLDTTNFLKKVRLKTSVFLYPSAFASQANSVQAQPAFEKSSIKNFNF